MSSKRRKDQGGAEAGAGATRRKPGTPPRLAPPSWRNEHVIIERTPADSTAAADRVRRLLAVWIVRSMSQGTGASGQGESGGAAAAGPSERPVASEGPDRQAAPPEAPELGSKVEGPAPDRGGK